MQNYYLRAKELIQGHKKEIIPTLFFITLVTAIPYLFGSTLTFILSILVISIGYGNICVARKVVSGSSQDIDTYNDGMAGITKYSHLFSTYFLSGLIPGLLIVFASFLYGIGFAVLLNVSSEDELYSIINSLNSGNVEKITQIFSIPMILLTVLFIVAVLVIMVYFITAYAASYYLIDHGYHGIGALKQSRKLMKGHKWQYIELYLHYAIVFIGSVIVGGIVYTVVSLFNDGLATVLATVVAALVCSAYIFDELYVVKYLFMADIIGEVIEVRDVNNDYSDPPQYEESFTFQPANRVEFEPVSKLKLLLGCVLYVPFYLEFASYVLSIAFLAIAAKTSITNETVLNSWYNLFYDSILAILGIILFYDFFKGFFKRFYTIVKGRFLSFTLKGFAIVYGSNILSSIIVSLINSGNSTSANQEGIDTIVTTYPIPMIIAAVVFAPILEELIFRGLIFRFVRNWNKYLAILVSGFLFGFIHISEEILVYQNYAEFVQIIPYFVMGVIFASFYEKEKSLSVPIYFHMLNNLIACMFMLI